MNENEKIELFDKWYDENYDEWAEGEEGIALREELEQAFKGGIAELEKENAELKEQISTKDILIKELQEQKVYWKNSSFDWRHKFFKLDKVKRLVKKDKQLKQAKELLAKWVELFKPKGGNMPPTPIQVETDQFIKDSEK
jgi:hypothetical protein